MSKTIVLTGGGTCGHIMPNIALLPELRKHFDHIAYIGAQNSQEERIAKQNNLDFYDVRVVKFERNKIWKNFAVPMSLYRGVKEARQLLSTIKPSVIFAKGGYVSLPTALAAKKLNIPVITHESDLTFGLANKVIARNACKIITSHKETKRPNDKYVYIGNPIRRELLDGNKTKLIQKLGIRQNYPTILVFGGSLGAKAINSLTFECIDELTHKYNILHITGNIPDNGTMAIAGYYPIPFTNDISDYYATADLIISRAGASAITEISAVGKRVIYIPLPQGNSRGDQVDNAKKAEKQGAIVLEQSIANKDTFIAAIAKAFSLPPPPKTYSPDVPARIVDVLIKAAKSHTVAP